MNIVNHVYLNLAGQETGSKGLYRHKMQIFADKYAELSPEWSLPTGRILDVAGTEFDFREPRVLGEAIAGTETKGYDINYAVNGEGLRKVARVTHPPSGRSLEVRLTPGGGGPSPAYVTHVFLFRQVWSDRPGVQFYTSNFLAGVPGKARTVYEKHGAFCLETQGFPDAVNRPEFPSIVLEPGQTYCHTVSFAVGLLPKA